jgi:hypothetical protein
MQDKALIEPPTKTFGQFDRLFIRQQAQHIPETVIHSCAVAAALKVIFDLQPDLSREIAFEVIG